MKLKIKNKEKKKRKVGAAIFRSQIESSLLSYFAPLPTIWKPRDFFLALSPTAEAVTMLCWERVGAKYTVAVCITRSLDRAWVRYRKMGFPPARPPPPNSQVHQMLILGNFRIPECYARRTVWFVFIWRSGLSIFLTFPLLFALHKWHLTKEVSSYSKFSFLKQKRCRLEGRLITTHARDNRSFGFTFDVR